MISNRRTIKNNWFALTVQTMALPPEAFPSLGWFPRAVAILMFLFNMIIMVSA